MSTFQSVSVFQGPLNERTDPSWITLPVSVRIGISGAPERSEHRGT